MSIPSFVIYTIVLTFFGALVCYGIASDTHCHEKSENFDIAGGVLLIICMIFLIYGGVGFIGSMCSAHVQDSQPYETETLVSLQDNNRYYISRYSTNNQQTYIYMRDLGNGGYSQGSIKAENVVVYMDESNPRVEWYMSRGKFLGFSDSYRVPVIYVPKGTILEEFSIDLK